MFTVPIASLCLRSSGWRYEGTVPQDKKFVCLAVPHTSNWDGLLLVLMAESLGLKLSWMIKKSHVRGPFGQLVRRFGAVAIDRSQSNDVVEQMIHTFRTRESFVLAIAPEGTRRRAEHWKSGFYHIAKGAGVPIVPAYLDYGRKCGGMGQPIHLTGDVRADMDRIRAFYEQGGFRGKWPKNAGPIRLREEAAG